MFLGFNKRRQEHLLYPKAAAEGVGGVTFQYTTYFVDQMISVLTASIVMCTCFTRWMPGLSMRLGQSTFFTVFRLYTMEFFAIYTSFTRGGA